MEQMQEKWMSIHRDCSLSKTEMSLSVLAVCLRFTHLFREIQWMSTWSWFTIVFFHETHQPRPRSSINSLCQTFNPFANLTNLTWVDFWMIHSENWVLRQSFCCSFFASFLWFQWWSFRIPSITQRIKCFAPGHRWVHLLKDLREHLRWTLRLFFESLKHKFCFDCFCVVCLVCSFTLGCMFVMNVLVNGWLLQNHEHLT